MKALSLWQPWASAIALGLKKIETRGWHTPHRGLLAIHAAGTNNSIVQRAFVDLAVIPQAAQVFFQAKVRHVADLPRYAVVAFGELYEIEPTSWKESLPTDPLELALGDYSPGRYMWKLRNVRRLLKPFSVPGRQNLFEVPDYLTQPDYSEPVA